MLSSTVKLTIMQSTEATAINCAEVAKAMVKHGIAECITISGLHGRWESELVNKLYVALCQSADVSGVIAEASSMINLVGTARRGTSEMQEGTRKVISAAAPEISGIEGQLDIRGFRVEDSNNLPMFCFEQVKAKRATSSFDVFLCHKSADKPEVKQIGEALKQHGILPWLDEWELRPGHAWQSALEKQIGTIKSAAVFVGGAGIGPWQEQEIYSLLCEFVERRAPVIPVLLRGAPHSPELPRFLRNLSWVDFRVQDPDPLRRLIWGITGSRPET
jgi:hypothetical protein